MSLTIFRPSHHVYLSVDDLPIGTRVIFTSESFRKGQNLSHKSGATVLSREWPTFLESPMHEVGRLAAVDELNLTVDEQRRSFSRDFSLENI